MAFSCLESTHYLFVGLGNPGPRYAMTRHNVGYRTANALASHMGVAFKEEKRCQALVAKAKYKMATLHLMLPVTFMNLSGIAIKNYIDFYQLPLKEIVVIHDDIAIPFSQMRFKTMGGSGGHNGLKSISHHLQTDVYTRLRIGIGHPRDKNLAEYVLENFSEEEEESLTTAIVLARDLLLRIVEEGVPKVMSQVNCVLPSSSQKKIEIEKSIDLTKPFK